MLKIIRFLDDHAARIQFQKSSLHFFEVVDLQTNVVQAGVHVHFAEGGALLEKRQIVKSIGDRDVALWRAIQFLGAKKTMVEVDEFCWIFGQKRNVTQGRHGSLLGIGVMEYWNVGVLDRVRSVLPSTPVLQHSITPTFFLISDILRKPFERQRMAESFSLGELVRCSTHRGEL